MYYIRAFDDLYVMESKINDAYNKMGDVSEDEMNRLLEQVGEWQEILEQRGSTRLMRSLNELHKV